MATKTGYKTAPQQHYRIQQGTYAFMKLTLFATKESVAKIVKRCTSHLKEELQLKSIFYVDNDKEFVLQQYADTSRIHFSQVEVLEDDEIPESISDNEKKRLGLEEGAVATVTYYTKKDCVILVMTTFSCVLDEYSLGLLAHELTHVKRAKGHQEGEISYLQYANWQSQLIEENKGTNTSKEKLAKHGEQWMYSITSSNSGNYRKRDFTIEAAIQSQILQISKELELPIDTIFLTAFAICCYRLNLSKNAAFGISVNGRYFDEIKNQKGVLAKTFPFYVEISEDTTLVALLKINKKAYEALQESHANYEEQKEDASTIQFLSTHQQNTKESDWFSPSEPFSLRYEISTSDKEIKQAIRYNKDSVSEKFVEDIAITLNAILTALTKDGNSKVSAISFASSKEKSIFPKEAYSKAKYTTLDTLFKDVFKTHKDDIAVRDETTSLLYRDVASMASQVAHFITPFTQNNGEGVAVLLDQKVDLPSILLGVWMRGAHYIPIPTDCPEERLKEIVKDSGAKVVITNKLGVSIADIPVIYWSLHMWNTSWSQEPTWKQRTPSSVAYMIYTSGTSGKPKGVKVPDSALINYTHWLKEHFAIEKGAVSSMLSSYAFDLVYTAFWGALCNGAQICIPSSELVLHAEKLVQHIVDEKLTFVKLTPSHLKIIKEARNFNSLQQSNLLYLFLGGEPIQVEDVKLVKELVPDCKIINHYGPTETTIGVVFTELPNNLDAYAQHPWIGNPIAHTKAYILNKKNEPLGIGQVGELAISGASLSLGYHNSEALHKEKFIEIFVDGATTTIYKTGDLAYTNHQNQIVLLGRADSQVKINGHRIEPEEIRQAILHLSEMVKDCYVLVTEINQVQRLLAFIKGKADEEELQSQLKKHLPAYMIPELVFMEAFPITANGKIDRKSLLSLYTDKSDQKEIIAPETDLEREFSLIWKEVLGVETLSVTANFFELGGDSIRAIQLISRLIKKGCQLEVRNLFEFSDVRSLAAYYESSFNTGGEKKKIKPKEKAFLLSPLQEGMFFLSLTADKRSHFIQRQFRFTGDFDTERFSEVVQEAGKVFPILKARFFMSENQKPMQEFVDDRKIPIQKHQLQDLTPKAQLEAIAFFKDEQLHKGVDLSVDPLFMVNLWQTNANTYELLLSYHHIILDGWCFQILASKIIEAYDTGKPISNDGAPPYSKFIAWIATRKQENDLKFWENYLHEYSGTTQLKDYLHEIEQVGYKHAILEGVVPLKTFSALKDFCKLHRLTQGFVLQQIWGLLLAKYTSREDVVFATTVSGRPPELEGSESMVGLFINTLPYRVIFEPETSFVSWLKNTSLDYPDWLSNQFVRLSDIQSLTSSKENLVKHLFVLENYPIRSSTKKDANLDLEIEQKGGDIHLNYDLSLVLYPEEDLKIQWIYNQNAYSTDFVQQLNSHLELLIQQLVNTPEIRLKELKLTKNIAIPEFIISSEENEPSQFLERIEKNLNIYKHKIAVKTDAKNLTYKELNEQSNKLASALLSTFSKGDAIGIYMTPNTDLVLAILGALRAGITYVPLDPQQAHLRLQHIVEDAQVQGILSEEKLTDKATELFKNEAIFTLNSLHKASTKNVKSVVVNTTDEVYRIFTSGSTGRPKGCCIQHQNLFHLFRGTNHHFTFSSEDRWIMLHSFGFDFSVWEIWGAIWSGASVYIPEPHIARNPKQLKRILAKEKITILNATPGAFYALIDTNDEKEYPWEDTIRYVVFGGDKLAPHRLKKWYTSNSLDHLKLINMYGITETTVHNTFKEISLEDIQNSKNLSPIGTPFTGVKMYCLDAYFNELPPGIVGELFIGGGGVSKGYYQQPELSKKVFLLHPDHENSFLYRSGDLGFKDSKGEYYYIGRKDHQVQIRGFRIALEEIKKAFLQHVAIKDVALIKREGKIIEKDRIEAYYTLKDKEEQPDVSELRLFLGDRISWYMIPAVITCVNEIPLTANGKFNLSAIEEVGDKKANLEHTSYTEYELIRLWEKLFNTTSIGLDDDFFDLGGNSLLAIKFITAFNKEKQINIDIGEVFRQRTIRLLAASLDNSDTSQFTSPYQVFNSGKAKKVFFFPPAFAFGFVFGRLAIELKDYEVIAFNYIDEDDSIVKYANFMHELQPTSDFVLAGFSSGGSLAFEVTKALEKKGRVVSNMILLDSKMNKEADLLSNEQCSEIADYFLNDPRANEFISGEKQKKLMWETIRKCAKFIHSLENKGVINTHIHLITSDSNHENTQRIENWKKASKRELKTYKGKGKHDEMLDPQNFEHNKEYFSSILDDQ